MLESERQQALNLIAAARSEFEASSWWTSGKKSDSARRSFAKGVLRDIEQHLDSLMNGVQSVERLLSNLKFHFEDEEVYYGMSVGFKRSGPGKIVWINIEGATDPIEASKFAATSTRVKHLKAQGYREYGISPLKSWRTKASAQADMAGPRR
ncbi:hypothetical protein [Rhizobium sp. MHM7A]|uniref:hypothetical protein n=1 Tax=Rhizobium sp. MHM7A TaxID=2583233 RepID=UPI0011062BD4|nr:hypothetical protein [Rhizobium sp. MHM7A]TLX17136.1 hypothetical protein FFR93_07445 [Rhizobium sp. MHM7A]